LVRGAVTQGKKLFNKNQENLFVSAPQRKTLKTGYRDVTFNSQLPSLNAKHRASLFSRFSLL
jgi:DNA-binding cell septation regulator SpoVG